MAIIKIFIAFILFIVIFDKLTRKYLNPYKTILWFGKKGAGKTTLLTHISMECLKNNEVVYNSIEIPGTRLFNPRDLGKFKPVPYSTVNIDEVGLIWDNRKFKEFDDGVNEFFKYCRQYKIKVNLVSQSPDIDIKILRMCDMYYLVENKMRVLVYAKRVQKALDIGHDTEGKGRIIDNYEIAPLLSPMSRKVIFIPKYVTLFKSYNPPIREDLPYKEISIKPQQIELVNNYWKYEIKKRVNGLSEHIAKCFMSSRCIKWINEKRAKNTKTE